ncbi:hypothetical protein [Polaromonas eurypsychrophila]|uniref:Uncharacterized protein n=1 Tax=Polaromonas eurypsychrophila TaxID=1614635 RepID=A0A916WN52_9BURK|nr:hypothetical protein [Polaromonas eurypsychrophila]GGB13759.1 hypothetical protein GCM10011496_38390 [Polaromonas eurypsychrophila]
MPILFIRGSQTGQNALALTASFVLAVLSYGVNAASSSGTASATVLGQISSQPVAIVSPASQQPSQSGALPLPIRLGFTIDRPPRSAGFAGGAANLTGEGSSFGITMIDVDASGVARFSVAGAGSTSGYIVQFPASADSLLGQSPTAAINCAAGSASNGAQACRDSSLIVPAQALEGGGRLAVEISQALSKLIAGELSVQVNYN